MRSGHSAFHSDPSIDLSNAEHWKLERLAKYSSIGVERSVRPSATIRRARKVLKAVGVTTVADVTRLDDVGIPNYMTVRPRDTGPGISYYNGKGVTVDDAHAGALMEAIERHAGESCSYPKMVASYSDLALTQSAVSPGDMIVPAMRSFTDDLAIEWVKGFDLVQKKEVWAPLNAVVCPYESTEFPRLFYASTNGLASGNSITEAICHALCEVIERDAQAMCMARLRVLPVVASTLAFDLYSGEGQSLSRVISQKGLPIRANRLVRKLEAAGLRIILRDFTSTAGIATIDCTLLDDHQRGVARRFGGLGTHPDARIALTRAITEAAQSRITFIQGGREDIAHILENLGPEAESPGKAVPVSTISFEDVPTFQHKYIDEDIELMLKNLPASGIHQVIGFDLTRPEVGIPVVKLVLPRAETWTVFHLHTGRGSLGPRAVDAMVSYASASQMMGSHA
jgi:ribosomal protein S12 methylthiotransferase accessory factor